MNKVQPWKRLSIDTDLECPAFRVQRIRAQAPEGLGQQERDYYRLEAEDWVNIVALTTEGEMVLIQQYRHGAGTITLEMPGGRVDPGEDPAQTARRELLEETGYEPESLRKLGQVRPNPALMSNTAHTYLAENCRKVADLSNDPDEHTLPVLIPASEIPGMVESGEIDHAIMVAALHLWQIDARKPQQEAMQR